MEDLESARDHARSGSGVRRRRAAPKVPAPISGEAWGILNPFGDFWTYQTFASEAWAAHYIKDFWAGSKNKPDLTTFTPIRVLVTVSAIADTTERIVPAREGLNPSSCGVHKP